MSERIAVIGLGYAGLPLLDALIYAVNHDFYQQLPCEELLGRLHLGGVLVDVKAVLDPKTLPSSLHYSSL